MIYKNGIKEFLSMFFIFGGCMSVYFILSYGWVAGLIGGITAGLLFAGLMFLVTYLLERKFNKMRDQIAAERRIICDGGATWQGLGGWMFLTEQGLEFYPHKLNHGQQNFAIPVSDLTGVTVKRNMVTVSLSDGGTVTVVVSHAKEWMEQIKAVIASCDGEDDYGMT